MGNGINWDAVQAILGIVNFVCVAIVFLWMRHVSAHQVTEDTLTAAKKVQDVIIANHAERITRLEAGPNHDDMAAIHEKLNEMNSAMQSMAGEFRGTKDLLATVHKHLLDQH